MHRSSFPTIFQKFILINIQSDTCKHSPPPLPSPSKKNVARGSWATSLTCKQLQSIYTFAQSYYNTCTIMIHVTLIKRKKTLSLFWELKVLNLWKLLHPIARMLCTKFGWNWPNGSREEDFKILPNVVLLSPWKRAGSYIWTIWISIHPRMLYAKFGWNWPRHYGEKRWKCEKFTDRQTDGWTTYDRQQAIRKA